MNPPFPSRIGKATRRKDIFGNSLIYTVTDEDIFLATSDKNKAFCLHKLQYEDGKEGFRIGYYMITEGARMKGKWAWGQFSPMMTKEEMGMIIERIQAKG